jgi:hypothetical protein
VDALVDQSASGTVICGIAFGVCGRVHGDATTDQQSTDDEHEDPNGNASIPADHAGVSPLPTGRANAHGAPGFDGVRSSAQR